MKLKNTDMLSGSITKGLISMSIPIMIVNITTSLFNMFDMVMLRIFSDESAVGAVGACGMLITLCTTLLTGTSLGTNIVVAKRIGARDRDRTEKAVTTSLVVSLVGSLVLLIVGVTCAELFLKWTNCSETLLPQASTYFKLYFYGFPFYMFYTFCAAVLRAMGDTKRPMCFMMAGGIVKVILTPFFVAVFHMDVAGVACATAVAHLFESCLAFWAVYKSSEHFCIDPKKITFDMNSFKEILRIGIPTGIHSAMFAFMNLLITSTVNRFGEAATTGIAIASQFDVILYHICTAPSVAITPYIAQNIGAGHTNRVKQTVVRGVLVTIAFGIFFGTIFLFLSRPLVMAMSSSDTVIHFAMQRLVVMCSTYFICGIQDAFGGVFRGLGKSGIPPLVTLMCVCPVRVFWVYILFPRFPNMTFLYAVCSAEWVLTSMTQFVIYLIFVRRRIALYRSDRRAVT